MAGFQLTICNVGEFDYLIRKINDQDLPEIAKAKAATASWSSRADAIVATK